jgi:hypothetical protein
MENEMRETPIVYAVQDDPKKNLLPAAEFGDIVPLLAPGQGLMHSSSTVAAVRHLRTKLKGIRPQDYILLVGDPMAIGIVCAIAAEFLNGRLRVLKWDGRERCYYVVSANLNGE